MSTLTEVQERIANYRAAYKAANGTSAPPVAYERGWYIIGDGVLKTRHRASQVDDYTSRLLFRAKDRPC